MASGVQRGQPPRAGGRAREPRARGLLGEGPPPATEASSSRPQRSVPAERRCGSSSARGAGLGVERAPHDASLLGENRGARTAPRTPGRVRHASEHKPVGGGPEGRGWGPCTAASCRTRHGHRRRWAERPDRRPGQSPRPPGPSPGGCPADVNVAAASGVEGRTVSPTPLGLSAPTARGSGPVAGTPLLGGVSHSCRQLAPPGTARRSLTGLLQADEGPSASPGDERVQVRTQGHTQAPQRMRSLSPPPPRKSTEAVRVPGSPRTRVQRTVVTRRRGRGLAPTQEGAASGVFLCASEGAYPITAAT